MLLVYRIFSALYTLFGFRVRRMRKLWRDVADYERY